MSTEAEPAIEISCRDVWKVFGRHPERVIDGLGGESSRSQVQADTGHVIAVQQVSFDVYRGKTFVVMGLSGSGKSTLVRCICRLTEPTRGRIMIGGRDVVELDEGELRELRRRRISMVFQHFGLFSHRRVIDNVAYGLEVQGVKKSVRLARAKEMIDVVGLSGWERYYPQQLSGGMQQRVGLARALTVDPDILLFDEPFSALDPLIRRELQHELLRLQTVMQKTIVFVTHDFAEALTLGDHIAIMRDGRFVQVGAPEELVTAPADDYVRAFTRDIPRPKVITLSRIMQPCDEVGGRPGPERAYLRAGAKLEDALLVLAGSEQPLLVVDEDDTVMGCVDRAVLLAALAG